VKEYVAIMKKLWTGEYVGHEGKYANFPPVICLPKPTSRPHPPIMLGSIGSPNVFRRVVQWGDGWLPFVVDPKEIADGRAEIAKYAKEAGRDPASIIITAFAAPGLFQTKADVKKLADAGADNMVVFLNSETQAEVLAEIEALAKEFF
jgi:alkanesulfonate monooxygenase SsuD/methylene tetrahydromethanopterin reductase-like flavin-dependent oxidoreductase (luciferase family)